MPLSIIILAAGQGTRMKSARPKVAHAVAGRPMLQHVVDTSLSLAPDQMIIVVGYQSEQIRELMKGQDVEFVEQSQQLGTGHALAKCLDDLKEGNDVLVLNGDGPLVRAETLKQLLKQASGATVCLLSFLPDNPYGYGRIQRSGDDKVVAIVEEKDASAEEKKVRESYSGILFIEGSKVRPLVEKLDNNNAQSEYYLTDVVKHAVSEGLKVAATIYPDADEVSGINNQAQLAEAERIYRQRLAEQLMQQGVKLYDPARIDIRGSLKVGSDVEIDINCVFAPLKNKYFFNAYTIRPRPLQGNAYFIFSFT